MAWFRRAKGPGRDDSDEVGASVDPDEAAQPAVGGELDSTDTVGNPIIRRSARDAAARHSAPDAGPTRAEHRMLQFVAEGRVARTATGGAAAAFWRIDGAFATGTKAMMLDFLFEEGYVELGQRGRVAATAVLTETGQAVLDGPG